MTSADLGAKIPQGIGGHSVATCALIYFYVREEPLNEAGPMLSRLLSYTTRLIFHVDAPSPDLDHFTSLLSAALKPSDTSNSNREVTIWTQRVEDLIRESSSFSGLHNFFTKVERLLITEELYDEVHNVTINPAERKIDEQSPFGHYLQLCLDHYLCLQDDEVAKIVRELQGWIEGGEQASANRKRRDNQDKPSLALRSGDYSLARAELEGFFDRSPLDSSNSSLQETLLKNAIFHYQTKAYESARASLDESLRLSRGVNDLLCISACDKLLRRIDHEDGSEHCTHSIEGLPRSQPVLSLQDLWQVNSQVDLGKPLLPVLAGLSELLHPSKAKGKLKEGNVDEGPTSEEYAECCLCEAKIWYHVGVRSVALACQTACVEGRAILEQAGYDDLSLPVAIVQSQAMVDQGRFDEALCILFSKSLLHSLRIDLFRSWQAHVWNIVYKAALQSGSSQTIDDIRAVRPEVVKEVEGSIEQVWQDTPALSEPNEASFDRSNKTTLSQQLSGKLEEAKLLRLGGKQAAASLTMATQIMRRAEEADLFRMYRLGAMECAEALLALGTAARARELIDGIMPQLLVDSSAEIRGRAALLYVRVLLMLQRHTKTGPKAIFPWLNRAKTAFQECRMVKELSEVLYIQARLYAHLDLHDETEKSSQEYQQAVEEWTSNKQNRLGIFDTVQSIIRLVGAHVVAGG